MAPLLPWGPAIVCKHCIDRGHHNVRMHEMAEMLMLSNSLRMYDMTQSASVLEDEDFALG